MTLRAFVISTIALASACGGSYQGETTGGGGGPTTSATPASINLVPNTTSLPANADGTAGGAPGITLTAIVLDANNNAVSGATVKFSAVSGRTGSPAAAIIGAGTTTDSNGVVQATLTTGGNANIGAITVTAATGSLNKSVTINVVSPTVTGGGSSNAATATNLTLAASSSQLAANASTAGSGVTVTAFVADANNNAIAGVPVTFSSTSTGGSGGQIIVNNGTSDSSGQASAVLTTGGDPTGRCITVTVNAPATSGATLTKKLDCATGSGITVTSTTSGTPVPSTLALLASSPQLSSNGSAATNGITLTALVKDANNNVIPGVNVSFATPNSGAITVTQGTTDSSGQATALLTTGGDPTNRPINVIATTSNGVSGNATVTVVGTTLTVSGISSAQSGVASTYTAVLLDSGGTPIANKPVTFAYSGTGSLNPSTSVTTNASGQAQVALTPTASGTLTATALPTGSPAAPTLTATQDVAVSTDCFVFSSPAANATVNLNTSQTITVTWKTGGCSGTPVANGNTINFSTTRGNFTSSSATTSGGTGSASVDISAAQAGFATLTAAGTSGNKPTATLQIEFVATVPKSVSVQTSPATIGTNQQSTVTAVVLDANNNLVKNATVQFTLTDTTGGTLSAGQAVTNSQGKAQVTYSASSSASSANGVKIKADVTSVLLPSGSSSAVSGVSGNSTLTVGGAALHITLGTGNEISDEGPSSGKTTYVKPWVIVVRDSAGNPAQNASVALSIHPISYGKGCSAFNSVSNTWYRTDCSDGSPISCTSEDLLTGDPNYDFNGILDPGEDLNGDGILQPGGIVEVPSTVTLDANGTGTFEIRYPKDEAYWVTVRLRATASVSGTESVNQTYFTLQGKAADFSDAGTAPPGIISPHGFLQDCSHEPVVSFTKAAQGVESGSTATANITLSSPAGLNSITLPVTVSGTGAQNTDFRVTSPSSCTPASCSVTIPAGGSASKIDVSATPASPGLTAKFALGTPSSQAVLGTPSTHTVILDGAAVAFSTGSTTIPANNIRTLTVKLDRAVGSSVGVPFSCSAGDYTLGTTSPVTIPAGSTSASISITNTNATTSDELVTCTLGTPTGPAALGSTTINLVTLSHP